MTEPTHVAPPDTGSRAVAASPHRWGILGLIGVAQLMVVLDTTVVNIALPSAQGDLGFGTDARQWVVTAYALAFGSLLLLGGRLSDLFGQRITLVTGLLGFAIVSAVGGASVNFVMLVSARALQGVFAAILAPAALSTLNVTFTDTRERARAFGVYTAVAGGGGVIGLILGGVLTEWLSWRWCLYVNLVFAIPAAIGVLAWVRGTSGNRRVHIDIPGVVTGPGGLFCLVYGLSNAQEKGWSNTLTVAMLVAAGVLLIAFAVIETRVAQPLLPLRIVADRNRGASFLAILTASCSFFAAYLFLTYFFQANLGYSPLMTGLAFLPLIAGLMVAVFLCNLLLVPRLGPRPLVPVGMLIGAGAIWWLAQLSVTSTYSADVLGPIFVLGLGLGGAIAPSIVTSTAGVDAAEAGVGSAMVNTSQQVGGAIGAAALSAVFTNALASYVASHHPTSPQAAGALRNAAAIHGYSAAFTVSAFIFLAGAVVTVLLLRSGKVAPSQGVAAGA